MATKTTFFHFFLLCILLHLYGVCVAQAADPDPEKWANELNQKGQRGNDSLNNITATLQHIDSAKAFRFLDELQKKGTSKGDRFRVRFKCLKASTIYYWLAYYDFYQYRKPLDGQMVKFSLYTKPRQGIKLARQVTIFICLHFCFSCSLICSHEKNHSFNIHQHLAFVLIFSVPPE